MSSAAPPYWRLISVLTSTVSLEADQAMALFETALGLHHREESMGEILMGPFKGSVQNLKKHVSLGTFAGPSFEAQIDTAHGSGTVKFFLTREALELGKQRRLPPHSLN